MKSTNIDGGNRQVAARFEALVRRDYPCIPAFGVARADMLRRTGLFATYADCDRVLIAEIGLQGRVVELAEPLFVHRQHRNRSVWQFTSRQTRNAWFDPSLAGRPAFPYMKQFRGYLGAIRRAPLTTTERLQCAGVMARWLGHNVGGLWEDVTFAGRYALRPMKRRFASGARSAGPAHQ